LPPHLPTFANLGASCRPASPGEESPVPASSVTRLPPHLPSYVLANLFPSVNYCSIYRSETWAPYEWIIL
jgi:hypothetical protein